jgi:hypothetical protein
MVGTSLDEVVEMVSQAFKEAKLEFGCISLRQARLIDDYIFDPLKMEGAWKADWKGHWSEAPEKDLSEYCDTLHFFNEPAHLYYLAAFMWRSLVSNSGSIIWDQTVNHLTFPIIPGARGFEKFQHLTSFQRSAVIAFLQLALDRTDEEDNVTRAELEAALAAWRNFTHPI